MTEPGQSTSVEFVEKAQSTDELIGWGGVHCGEAELGNSRPPGIAKISMPLKSLWLVAQGHSRGGQPNAEGYQLHLSWLLPLLWGSAGSSLKV